ncbi:MAG: 1-acyl-sn-glycerol-3-phosphate acyltransferase [Gemmatimonadota bacterium]|nr:1-acyl-sn-glycerol-3-phosphate acyltransferase [Gemmatimonadota bacterium]
MAAAPSSDSAEIDLDLPFRDRFALSFQNVVGRILAVIWLPAAGFAMRVVMRYRVPNVSEIRRRYRRMVKEADSPILICANHLTMVDSAVVAWALGGSWWYLFNYRRLPWNLPEQTNYGFNWFNRVGVWILKCIPIRRGGRREDVSSALKRVQYLLTRGDTAIIFAEGGRSRSGRIELDSVAHGMGRIMNSVKHCKALCVYLRGDRQLAYSAVPARGDSFYVDFELFQPESPHRGMRRSRDFANQIAERLVEMEERYFARRK